ncbi:helix-turn-helix domain-containing protein [Pseudonocardia spinosispora]|uniref:helix-turn-helix domain-containing protein n=1 Tax=Pseudonocardia spinosispora TaxID=103441 RepID=UPI00040D53A1|nr:helix-turn-helix transcriptional regulator [Pseudonocardia spinosispora]
MAVARTVPALMLLRELDQLRQQSGVSSERAAEELGCRVSKISRIFLGQSRITPGDTKLLADLYGADAKLSKTLVDLARNLGRKSDWERYESVYREAFLLLPDLERHSSTIRMVQSEIIPGLLQTEGYLRALTEAPDPFGRPVDFANVAQATRERQEILTRSEPPTMVSFVLSESALRREYGGREVMHQQLLRLVEVGHLPNVQLQIVPFASPNPVTFASVKFELLHLQGAGVGTSLDFVHIELYDEAQYLDEPGQVAAYEQLWGHLQAAALGPTESAGFIGKVAEEYG